MPQCEGLGPFVIPSVFHKKAGWVGHPITRWALLATPKIRLSTHQVHCVTLRHDATADCFGWHAHHHRQTSDSSKHELDVRREFSNLASAAQTNAVTGGWKDERENEKKNEKKERRKEGRKESKQHQKNKRTNERTNEATNERSNKRTNEQTIERCQCVCVCLRFGVVDVLLPFVLSHSCLPLQIFPVLFRTLAPPRQPTRIH